MSVVACRFDPKKELQELADKFTLPYKRVKDFYDNWRKGR